MKKETVFIGDKYVLLIVIISLVVASLIHFPEIISLFDIYGKNTLFPGITALDVLSEVFFTFISLLMLFAIDTILFRFHKASAQLTWWKIASAFVLTWILSSLLGKIFVLLHHHFDIPAIDAMVHQYLHPVRDFVMSTIVTGSSYVIYLIRQKQLMMVENEQLHAENILNQYVALKNQLNPHMLFNSLNTLRSLVRESPAKAQIYIQELSRVLRYTLQENESQTVSLKEEMDFVNAYLYLLEMRYEDNLQVDIHVAECYESYQVPPMAVQMLIENAVKHNEISNRKPLTIRIVTEEDDFLSVYNYVQPKITSGNDPGIGLANLDKRYRLIYKQGIQIYNTTEIFRVRIPLIPLTE
ncbi:sensor histidine kinase [Parabacteroides pacaensis]|uniref:sensor histidine kinase n=1 Tax=Parabacteroides pacaensis TaxID=2086575 RepID=UPI000D0E4D0E|nr:histidine kinase [Parabacteroides pacaensis]